MQILREQEAGLMGTTGKLYLNKAEIQKQKGCKSKVANMIATKCKSKDTVKIKSKVQKKNAECKNQSPKKKNMGRLEEHDRNMNRI